MCVQLAPALKQRRAPGEDALRTAPSDAERREEKGAKKEFGELVSEWMPELEEDRIRDVCRLIDADGDGMIDFDEFSSVVAAQGDDMRKSTAGMLRARTATPCSAACSLRARQHHGAAPSSQTTPHITARYEMCMYTANIKWQRTIEYENV